MASVEYSVTASMLSDAMLQMKELVGSREEVLKARIDAMDRAVELIAQFPTAIDVAVGGLRDLHNEKFALHAEKFVAAEQARAHLGEVLAEQIEKIEGISEQKFQRIDTGFIERDKRTDQLNLANSVAIAAALQAQKEAASETNKSSALAIDKSEKSTIENIRQLQTLFQTAMAASTIQINDLKSRLDKGEGQSGVTDPATQAALVRMSEQIAMLANGAHRNEGKNQQVDDSWKGMLSVGSIAIALGAVVLSVFHHTG